MARSLLEQLTQIRRSRTYDDAVVGVCTSAVAEPTISGSLEEDLNVIRTLMKGLKGTVDWFGDLGNYFDPTNTDLGSTDTKDLNLNNISGNTLDSKTVIIAVSDDNSGSNYTVSGTSTGVLISNTTAYATPTDRRGLPIFDSVANTGSYWDEGGSDNTCRIDVLNTVNDAEFTDGTYLIYAKFHDGADFGGTGTGSDVYIRFYKNGSPCDLSGTNVVSIKFVYPQRRVMSAMQEHEWLRTDFVSSWEGDIELIEDISNLWSFTGASDNTIDPTWNNTGTNYLLNGDPDDLMEAIDNLNDGIGDATYTSTYLTNGEDITVSLNTLGLGIESNDTDISTNVTDISNLEAAAGTSTGLAGLDYSSNNYIIDNTSLKTAIGALDAAVGITAGGNKYIEEITSSIVKNTYHSLPIAAVLAGGYTPSSTVGREGANMDIYISGQLLAADTGIDGVNADRDYGETTTSGITFRFKISKDTNITYIIRQ